MGTAKMAGDEIKFPTLLEKKTVGSTVACRIVVAVVVSKEAEGSACRDDDDDDECCLVVVGVQRLLLVLGVTTSTTKAQLLLDTSKHDARRKSRNTVMVSRVRECVRAFVRDIHCYSSNKERYICILGKRKRGK
jgi:hypothetical protein